MDLVPENRKKQRFTYAVQGFALTRIGVVVDQVGLLTRFAPLDKTRISFEWCNYVS